MSLLHNPNSWLKKAVILTCMATVLSQAIALPATATEQVKDAASTATIQIGELDNAYAFTTQSMRGEKVTFLSPESETVSRVMPEFSSQGPMAAYLKTAEGDVACTVSENPGMVANLGNRIIQIDSTATGAVVDGSLTRLVTAAHEYGHCLDMLASTSISKSTQAAGISPYSVPSVAIEKALHNGSGEIDFDWIKGSEAAPATTAVESARGYHAIGISVLETYADLQGALQTASTTGDLRGFTKFEMAIRLNNLSSMDHTSAFAVAQILKSEVDNGFDASSLKGQSFDAVNHQVNEMFIRHFSKDGTLSIHSDGFKNIIKEFQMKEQIGVQVDSATKEALSSLAQATGTEPNAAEKAIYVELMNQNHANQARLVASANPSYVQNSSVLQMLDGLQTKNESARIALNAEAGNNLVSIFSTSQVSQGEVKDAALDFFHKALSINETKLQTGTIKLTDLLKDKAHSGRVMDYTM